MIDDYVIRMIENKGQSLKSIKKAKEAPIPPGIIEKGKIVDELQLFSLMKKLVKEWKIKHRKVRFYAPQSFVILRELDIPNHIIDKNENIKDYISMEVGHTIHFPFENPVFDLYDVSKENENTSKIILFAAPENEILKYVNLLIDSTLKPIAVDVLPLGIYRYLALKFKQETNKKVFLILNFHLTSFTISIFRHDKLEFMRHQSLNATPENWDNDKNEEQQNPNDEIIDHLEELERLMNFYQFSIHKGNISITDMIVTGDIPTLDVMTKHLREIVAIPVHPFTLSNSKIGKSTISTEFIPNLGLALKENQ